MRIGRNEIVEELMEHIRQSGGAPGEWCVGTAREDSKLKISDSSEGQADSSPHSRSEISDLKKDLACREAHTPYAAAEAGEYLVDAFGLQHDPASVPGRVAFVYHLAASLAAVH